MDVSKEVDRRIVINGIVTEMLKSGGVNIEICFDGRMSVSLSKDEILGIIKEMKYDGYYDEDRNVYKIWKIVKTEPEVPRVVTVSSDQFSEYKRKIESHINRTYMRSIQAPVGIKPRLVTWMQLV